MVKPDQSCTKRFFTYNSSGVLTDDDGTPVGVLVKNGTDTAVSVTVSKLATGVYKAAWDMPSDAVTGDVFELQITVTMSTVVQKDIIWIDFVDLYSNENIYNAAAFEKIIPTKMIIPTTGNNVYTIVVVAPGGPDNGEIGVNLLAGDNSILFQDEALTTPLADSVAFEDYQTMVALNPVIYLCYTKIANTEVLKQLNYVFVYAENGEDIYHTSCTVLVPEGASDADLATVDGIVDAIKLQTDKLHFTGDDVIATLDSEKVTVTAIDNDAITAASIKTDAITEIQSGLVTSTELGLVDDKIDTLDTNLDSLMTTVGTPTDLTIAHDIANISSVIVSGVPTNVTAGAGTITYGTNIANSYTSTLLDDGTYWTLAPVAVNGLDVYLEFTLNADQNVNTVYINGRYTGNNRFANVFAKNWTSGLWEALSDSVTRMNNSASDLSYNYNLLTQHKEDGTGKVQIRFYSTSTTTADRLYIDQVLVKVVTAGATAAQIADAVYMKTRYSAYVGAVWVDTNDGFAGSDLGIHGLPTYPVDNMADAILLATALGVRKFMFSPDSLISLTQDFSNWTLQGKAIIDVNSQHINDTYFIDSEKVTGTAGGDNPLFVNCVIEDLIVGQCRLNGCIIQGSFTALTAGNYLIDRCSRGITGTYLNFTITEVGTFVGFRSWAGVVKINNLTAGSQVSFDGYGKVIIGSDCTGGVIKIRGNYDLDDQVVDGFLGTIEDSARMAEDQNVYSVAGSVDSVVNAVTVGTIQTDVITAASIKADAVTEIQSGLATSLALTTTDGKVDNIKLQTDKLHFSGDDIIATLDSEKVAVASIDNDAITAAAIKTDAITEIQSGLATALGVTAVEGKVDGIVSTIGVAGAGLTALGDTRLANLDDAITSRMESFTYTAPDNQGITDIKTVTDKINFNVNDDVISTLDSEKVTVTAIDNDAITAAAIKADAITEIQSGLSTSLGVTAVEGKVDGIVTTLGVAGAGLTALGDTRLANLNDTITSRMATFTYTAPDNASITSIKGKTDNLPADPASNTQVNTRMATFSYTAPDNQGITDIKTVTDKINFNINDDVLVSLDGEKVGVSSIDNDAITAAAIKADAITEIQSGLATSLGVTVVEGKVDGVVSTLGVAGAGLTALGDTRIANLDDAITSRMETFTYTAPDNASITAIKAKTDNLSFTGTDVKATLDGETVTASTVSDKTGYALTAAYDAAKTAATQTSVNTVDGTVNSIKSKTDNLPADPASNTQVATRLASTGYTAPDNASITAIKAKTDQLAFSSGDVIATLNGETVTTSSVTDKTGYYLANDSISSATVAASAVTEIQSGLATSSALSTVDTVVDAIKAKTDNLPSDPASNTVVNTRLATTSYTAPDNSSIASIKERTDLIPDDPATETSLSGIDGKVDDLQLSVESGNNSTPTVENIVEGILAGLIDGHIDLKEATKRILAVSVNSVEITNNDEDLYKTFNFYDTTGENIIVEQRVYKDGSGREIV